ncbi:CobW/HypB/UreG, nucleotide-binding domain-containing protein [Chaetomium strumarium]|uniref:CobW/HypB/UreG, nucleotide-binding domain-containing protein n=1 Tax=Chaetomium strumarium TaxID=1170767 RepID=A0AAJ0GSC3_9PEZI|nr:CobW/HypB/UreG, nucleotide-binding domain-containing protein [Chaetomium strumarium]
MAQTRSKRQKTAPRKPRVPEKALPVTLLSGFLGSGKTTLLQHILRSEHGLRIAIIVNDIGAINVDASLIKQIHRLTKTEEKVIALQNGCICCTLRGDLLEELVRLSELQEFDYIIIESSGISEPEQVAETFDRRLAEQMGALAEDCEGLDEEMLKVLNKVKKAGGLDKFAKLDTTATVIDAFTIFNDFDTDELLSSRRDDVTPEDERTVSDLMVDQIEFADVIVLNKIDMVDKDTKSRIIDLITKLNHRAKLLESSYGKIDVKEIVNTGMFDMERAQTGYGWLQDLHAMTLREVNGRNVLTPKPETEEYNVRNFVYSRRRPFHPRRLWALLYDKFILQLETPEDDDNDDEDGEDEDEGKTDNEQKPQGTTDIDIDIDMASTDDNNIPSSPSSSRSTSSSSPSSTTTAATAPSSSTTHSNSKSNANTNSKDREPQLPLVAAETDDDDDLTPPSNPTILATKRAHPLFACLFRSKGEFLLATRPHRAGEWSQAGAMLTLRGGRPWFCTLPAEQYTTGDPEVDALVQHDIAQGGEWGDRRQEIVFIGEKLDVGGLERVLDACLLTDAEMKLWEEVMREDKGVEDKVDRLAELFEDGFPDWAEEEDGGHAGHDHGPGEHAAVHRIGH